MIPAMPDTPTPVEEEGEEGLPLFVDVKCVAYGSVTNPCDEGEDR